MSKKSLGYVLVTPDGARWWAGNGTLPVGCVRPGKQPLPLFSHAGALRAAAVRDVLGGRLSGLPSTDPFLHLPR
jgi:hypothetical protein